MTFLAPVVRAQAQAVRVITGDVDTRQVQALPNHHPLWANPADDAGAVPSDLALNSLTMVLTRSAQQEAAFQEFLTEQRNPASPNYHHWLTAAEVGERFGLAEEDIATLSSWLQTQGLHVNWVAPSRMFIGFGGTATDIGRAFQTELHYYKVNGEQRMSVNSDPLIPRALAPAIKAVRGLYTIEENPLHYDRALSSISPELGGGASYYLGPSDFDTIYNVPTSVTGAGVTVGIVGESRTDFADFSNFRALTGATFANPTEIIPTAYGGVDPGPAATTCCSPTPTQDEATLDVSRVGSVAPASPILLVAATSASGGIGDDAQYLVNTTPVPAQVMSISFGGCEYVNGSGVVDYWNTLFQTAAGEGISVFVSSGDSGGSGCDQAFTAPPASPDPNSPNALCSSSYVTCVGGTEFNDASDYPAYWNSSTGAALGYIPEGGWNESWNGTTSNVAASGGGVSAYIATPSWQTGTGVPAARAGRYTPDVAFTAADHDGYFGCFAAGGGSCVVTDDSYRFEIFSGTSAAAPGMAGVAALLDQKLGSAQGNLNPALYQLAASVPAAFHDVTVASSGVSSCSVNTPSMCNNSIPGPTGLTGGQAGYLVTTGYDEVTGLGSLNVGTFLNNLVSSPIVPYIQVNSGAWQNTASVTVAVGSTVNLGPQPASGGTWSWTGPNGFTSTSREIDGIRPSSATNVYTATYINASGVTSTLAFTITIGPTAITPYLEVNGGAWQATNNVAVAPGSSVNLGPQAAGSGTWSWSGPGFTSSAQQVNNIPLTSASNIYTATFTNAAGVTNTETFTITIAPTSITPYIEVNGGVWQATNNIAVAPGSNVNLGPQAAGSGTWSWSGPGFTSSAQQVNNVPLNSASNVYTASFTNAGGVTSSEVFTITIAPTTITPYVEVNNGAWQGTNNITVAAGSSVNLGPQAAGGGTWSWSGPGFTSSAQQVNNVPLTSASNVYTATFTNAAGAISTETFTITVAATPIVPYIEVNYGAWQGTNSVTVNPGSIVNLGPQAAGSGTWSWSGPSYTASTQQVNNVPLTSASNIYTATYTNVDGVTSMEVFTITVNATPITPYIQDYGEDGGAWQAVSSITANAGNWVNLGPQAGSGGTWSWSGPNGYHSAAQEIDGVPLTLPTNTYIATYTNPDGVTSTQTFTITIAPTAITPYIEVNSGAWQETNSLTVASGSTVNLGPQPGNGGSWSWSGPGGFLSGAREIDGIPLSDGTNTYVATYTNPAGVTSMETFTITVD
jgi:hypothetical protein